ncbi:class I SAM-dependent methyltransferase [Thermosulfuriphilus sp.]
MNTRQILEGLLEGHQDPAFKVRYWDGAESSFGQGKPTFTIYFKTPQALEELLVNPSIGFGEGYMRGEIDIEGDLGAVVALAYRKDLFHKLSFKDKGRLLWLNFCRKKGLKETRKEIQIHYDRGNDFYRLWLEKDWNYSCAYFRSSEDDLETAQRNKLHLIFRKLRLEEGKHLLDIGCGWGSLLLEAARLFPHLRGLGITLAEEQLKLARQRAQQEGVSDRIRFELWDYRELPQCCPETFDRIVSVGMFEHVGKEYISSFFEIVDQFLRPKGLFLLHTIGKLREEETDPWIRKYIFPGGYLPALGEIVQAGEKTSLEFIDLEDLRPHYYLTLSHWAKRFEAHREMIIKMFDLNFYRMWRLYLHGSKVSFKDGNLHVFQLLYYKGCRFDLPLNRQWLL